MSSCAWSSEHISREERCEERRDESRKATETNLKSFVWWWGSTSGQTWACGLSGNWWSGSYWSSRKKSVWRLKFRSRHHIDESWGLFPGRQGRRKWEQSWGQPVQLSSAQLGTAQFTRWTEKQQTIKDPEERCLQTRREPAGQQPWRGQLRQCAQTVWGSGEFGRGWKSLNVTISSSFLLHFDASPKTKQLQEQPWPTLSSSQCAALMVWCCSSYFNSWMKFSDF